MTLKLTKPKLRERDELLEKLRTAHSELDDAVRVFNEGLETLRAAFRPHVEAYNGVLGEVREWVEGVTSEAEDEMSEKSERWLDGERGEAAQSWITEWEQASFDDIDIDLPEDLDLSIIEDAAETLEQLPEEPS